MLLIWPVLLLLSSCGGGEPVPPPGGTLDLMPLAHRIDDSPAIRFSLDKWPPLLGSGWTAGRAVSRERHASLHLPFCPTDAHPVELVLRLSDPAAEAGEESGVIVSFNGRKVTRLLTGAEWADHRLELSGDWFHQGINELVFTAPPGRTAIRHLDLTLHQPLADLTAGDTTCQSLISTAPLVVDLPDPLPAGTQLDFSFLADGARYRIEGQQDDEWELLFEAAADPDHSWRHRTLSLEPPAGSWKRLRFSADGSFAAWGSLALNWPGVVAGPNLILILADTLRADRLGAGGSAQCLTPSLDALANQSVFFRDTLAQAPSTVPSVSSFFSGRYYNRLTHWMDHRGLPPAMTLFAEALNSEGCRTLAVVTNPLLMPEKGFARGFDEYHQLPGMAGHFHGRDELPVHQPAEAVNARFLQRLPSLERGRFFAYLHYMDPHDPYPVDHLEDGAPRFAGGRLSGHPWEGWLGPAMEEIIDHGNSSLGPEDRRMVAWSYDQGVRRFDRHLGLLLAQLRHRGLLDNTVVAVVADHGEEFFEHGLLGHGHTVYDELLRVPALIRFPAGEEFPRPAVVARGAELLDVAATLLHVMGAGLPEGHAGENLLPLLFHPEQGGSGRPRFFETRNRPWVQPPLNAFLVGIEADGWKMIRDRWSSEVRLYHLSADPGETEDQVRDHQEQATRMGRQLKTWLAGHQPLVPEDGAGGRPGQEVAQREIDALKALGYLQ